MSYHHMTGAYGPLKRMAEPTVTRRNPAPDRLPALGLLGEESVSYQ